MIVSLDNLKAHLNITFPDDDALLSQKLAVAETCVANYTGTAFTEYSAYVPPVLDQSGTVTTPETLSNAPAPIKEAVLKYAAHLYEYRDNGPESAPNMPPLDVFDLVGPYRAWTF